MRLQMQKSAVLFASSHGYVSAWHAHEHAGFAQLNEWLIAVVAGGARHHTTLRALLKCLARVPLTAKILEHSKV